MKLWTALILGFSIVMNTSCKKDPFHEETVTGIVLHSVTRQPLSNQEITLQVTTYKLGKKDPPEWPDGKPVFTNMMYTTTSDNSGRFAFNFEVGGEWMFSANLKDGEFIQKTPIKNLGFLFPGNGMILTQVKETYDTIYAEKPGYVRYHIQNTGNTYTNDSLFVLTHYLRQWIRPRNGFVPAFTEYNLIFVGSPIDKTITDTIPAESEPIIPIRWLHRRMDTITFKNDLIHVQPNTTVDYTIAY